MVTIYLAGPDVFEPNAHEVGEKLKALCLSYGFEGHFPLDNEICVEGTPYELAKAIREANIALIHKCDIVLANLNPFRGIEPDSGTVYEVGYAHALGKKVYGYANDQDEMIKRIQKTQNLAADAKYCLDEKSIEDFGLSHNLMMLDVVVTNDAEATLAYIKEHLS